MDMDPRDACKYCMQILYVQYSYIQQTCDKRNYSYLAALINK